jgi:hypothetical protein
LSFSGGGVCLAASDWLANGGCVAPTTALGEASGGGVDSDLIFARAFSAACRSAIPPAMLCHRLGDFLLDISRALHGLRFSYYWCWDLHNLVSDHRLGLFRFYGSYLAFETQPFIRLLASRTQLFVAGTLVHNNRVVVSDIRDVCRLIDDRHVALGRNHRSLHAACAKFICWNETVLIRLMS